MSDRKNGCKTAFIMESPNRCVCNLTEDLRVVNLCPCASTAGKNTLEYLKFPRWLSQSRIFFTAAAFSCFLEVKLRPRVSDHVSKLLTINKHKFQNPSQKNRQSHVGRVWYFVQTTDDCVANDFENKISIFSSTLTAYSLSIHESEVQL